MRPVMSRPIAFSFLYFGPRIDESHLRWFGRAANGYDERLEP